MSPTRESPNSLIVASSFAVAIVVRWCCGQNARLPHAVSSLSDQDGGAVVARLTR
ncbi:hypothetical protein KCP75_05280 [Salmonella enterica subsp. enterica]|nr:hypothetical protein KCP75_05280 [Salmonella enterica subsp. enterica]